MNRRGFLKAIGVGVTAVIAAAKLPASLFAATEPTRLFDGPLMFNGVPLVFDAQCQTNVIYFLNPETLWVNRGDGWVRAIR